MTLNADWVNILRCPIDGQPLELSDDGAWLINRSGGRRYKVENGIAMLLAEHAEPLEPVANHSNNG